MVTTDELAVQVAVELSLDTLFVKFICKRFPDELDYGYIKEWGRRFKSGMPTVYMDEQSKKIYKELV